jgi:hypothetical protein
VPLALAGGIFTIWLRGIPFSISAAVGFIAVSGVAVLNGLALMSSIRHRIDTGEDAETAIAGGAMERVRPVVMTALVASLGFVPMAIATGTGTDVQRPLDCRNRWIANLDLPYTFCTSSHLRVDHGALTIAGRLASGRRNDSKKPSSASSGL